jgi:hypothetical protein
MSPALCSVPAATVSRCDLDAGTVAHGGQERNDGTLREMDGVDPLAWREQNTLDFQEDRGGGVEEISELIRWERVQDLVPRPRSDLSSEDIAPRRSGFR